MTQTVEPRSSNEAGTSDDRTELYIGGTWVKPHSTETLEVFSPATGERVASVPLADEVDVDTAVRTARAAFDSGVWSQKSPEERAAVLDLSLIHI